MNNERAKLFEALAKAQGEFGTAVKTSFNPHFKSYFADLEELIRVTRPALAKHGLSVTQGIVYLDGEQFIETELGHSSGQSKISLAKISSEKPTLQSFGSAITYIERYAYKALLNIATKDDDDDGTAGNDIKAEAKPVSTYKPSEFITQEQIDLLDEELASHGEIKDNMLLSLKISSLNQVPKDQFIRVLNRVRQIKKTKENN